MALNPETLSKKIITVCFTLFLLLVIVGKLSELKTHYISESALFKIAEDQVLQCKDGKILMTFAKECEEATKKINHYPLLKAFELVILDFNATTTFYLSAIFNSWVFILILFSVMICIIFLISNWVSNRFERIQYRKSQLSNDGKQQQQQYRQIEYNDSKYSSAKHRFYVNPVNGEKSVILELPALKSSVRFEDLTETDKKVSIYSKGKNKNTEFKRESSDDDDDDGEKKEQQEINYDKNLDYYENKKIEQELFD